uniref:U4/U6.U5 trisnRNPassociated protein putative n=1 Tax=Albugo laibachii Nc14 TaxID=890382 RepID=F0WG00_9STRA|nr:U4/U6.U5 trisnRNPassociated protein putative [Albugo laibachii Nc14]|eukprot:CCA20134.1 U4/U6.U5 trisnRNPassociated protein putative [Albugo laibachii Nc14]
MPRHRHNHRSRRRSRSAAHSDSHSFTSSSRSSSSSPRNHRKRSNSRPRRQSQYKSRYSRRSKSSHRSRSKSPRRTAKAPRNHRQQKRKFSTPTESQKTAEEHGESSLSIEETNRLRLQLGLKPLSTDSKSSKGTVNLQKSQEDFELEKKQKEVQIALTQSQQKRELESWAKEKSIGQLLSEESNINAKDWVSKTRQMERKVAVKEDEEEYKTTELENIKVAHAMDAFEEGEEVILTLKDTSLLCKDGANMNEDEDELVNVALAEKDRHREKQIKLQRAMMPAYTGYDDDEFIQVGKRRTIKPKLLGQYDEEEDGKARQEQHTFRLGQNGVAVNKKKPQIPPQEENHEVSVTLIMNKSAGITYEEPQTQFHKRKNSKKLLRRLDKEEIIENGVTTQENARETAALVSELEAQALSHGGNTDRRKRVRHEDIQEKEEEEKLARFQQARESANQQSLEAFERSRISKRRRVQAIDEPDDFSLELSASMATTRKWMQQIAELKPVAISESFQTKEERIASFVSSQFSENKLESDGQDIDSESDVKTVGNIFIQNEAPNSKAVIFNDATDFETRIKNAMAQQQSQFRFLNVSNPTTRESTIQKVSEPAEDVNVISKEESPRSADGEEGNDGKTWGEDQPLVGNGVAATLELLRKTGNLKDTRVERQAGRANDARDRDFDDQLRIKNGVKLDYRDEFGRLLTKKEAFRLLSYKFHGHEPGKKRKEKRIKQLKEEITSQKLLSGEGSTKMMKILEKKQKHAKQAHVILSGGT